MCLDGVGVGLGVTPTKSHSRSGAERWWNLGHCSCSEVCRFYECFSTSSSPEEVGFQAPPSPGARKLLKGIAQAFYKVLSTSIILFLLYNLTIPTLLKKQL